VALLKQAVRMAESRAHDAPALIQQVFTRENAETCLADADKVGRNREFGTGNRE
jgi:hypothetical protein